MLITEAVDAYFALVRPLELDEATDAEVHAAFQAAIHGDPKAFEVLYLHYLPMLTRVARSILKQPDDAEDVVHSVLLKLHAGGFKDSHPETPQGVTGLLVRSVMNKARSFNRKGKKQSPVPVGSDPEEGEIEPQAPPDTEPEQHEVKDVVQKALTRTFESARLNDKEREFITKLVGGPNGIKDINERGKTAQIAREVWPELDKPGWHGKGAHIRIYAMRVKERFLRHFCGDQELRSLLPPGRITGVCGEADETITAFAFGRMLVEDAALDADTIYDAVLAWIGKNKGDPTS